MDGDLERQGSGTKDMVPQARASLVAQIVKNLPAMRETWVRSLGWEDPLEKGITTHSSILAWRLHGQRSLGTVHKLGQEPSLLTGRQSAQRPSLKPCPHIQSKGPTFPLYNSNLTESLPTNLPKTDAFHPQSLSTNITFIHFILSWLFSLRIFCLLFFTICFLIGTKMS